MEYSEQQALLAVQRIFPCEAELCNQVPHEQITARFLQNVSAASRPFLIRLSGQSGTGKSTQLLPAVLSAVAREDYVQLNVGKFAPFHPRYDEWLHDCPSLVREKTNGFALRALVMFYTACLKKKVNVVLDMTLLEPEIEGYFYTLAKKQGYCIHTHVLGVPKVVSDGFIAKRQAQTNRCVFKKSSFYFFGALPKALKALQTLNVFDKNDLLIVWSHRHAGPVKITNYHNKSVLNVLQFLRQKRWRQIKNEKSLLKSKRYWIKWLFKRMRHV